MVAWVVVVLVSAVPAIVANELAGAVPAWWSTARLGVLGVLLVATLLVTALRPLWRFAVVMAVMVALLDVSARWDLSWPALQAVLGGDVLGGRLQAEQTGKLLVAAAMIGLLLVLGYRRRDVFLAVGDVRAPIRPAPLLGFPRAEPWTRFGGQWGVYVALGIGVALYLSTRPTGAQLAAVVPLLPAITVYAAVNAFAEEMTYRAPMLATLEPALGSTTALWQAALLFGVAHYWGTPGGPAGASLAVLMGWLLGKAMVETRGLLWAWGIHALSDVVIFTFLAASLVG